MVDGMNGAETPQKKEFIFCSSNHRTNILSCRRGKFSYKNFCCFNNCCCFFATPNLFLSPGVYSTRYIPHIRYGFTLYEVHRFPVGRAVSTGINSTLFLKKKFPTMVKCHYRKL